MNIIVIIKIIALLICLTKLSLECENGSFQNLASHAASSSRRKERLVSLHAASTWKDLKARRRPRGNSAARGGTSDLATS